MDAILTQSSNTRQRQVGKVCIAAFNLGYGCPSHSRASLALDHHGSQPGFTPNTFFVDVIGAPWLAQFSFQLCVARLWQAYYSTLLGLRQGGSPNPLHHFPPAVRNQPQHVIESAAYSSRLGCCTFVLWLLRFFVVGGRRLRRFSRCLGSFLCADDDVGGSGRRQAAGFAPPNVFPHRLAPLVPPSRSRSAICGRIIVCQASGRVWTIPIQQHPTESTPPDTTDTMRDL